LVGARAEIKFAFREGDNYLAAGKNLKQFPSQLSGLENFMACAREFPHIQRT
jgi:hypothetical protein